MLNYNLANLISSHKPTSPPKRYLPIDPHLDGGKDVNTTEAVAGTDIINNDPPAPGEEEKCKHYFSETKNESMKQQDSASTITIYQKFIQSHPSCTESADAYYEIGLAQSQLGNHREAIENFREALKYYDPYSSPAKKVLHEINQVYLEEYDFQSALKILFEFKQRHPESLEEETISVIDRLKSYKNNSSGFSSVIQDFLSRFKNN